MHEFPVGARAGIVIPSLKLLSRRAVNDAKPDIGGSSRGGDGCLSRRVTAPVGFKLELGLGFAGVVAARELQFKAV